MKLAHINELRRRGSVRMSACGQVTVAPKATFRTDTAVVGVSILLLACSAAHADPAPASIYAALQAQRNTCQDQAALAAAASGEELARVKAELAALKKDFGVKE